MDCEWAFAKPDKQCASVSVLDGAIQWQFNVIRFVPFIVPLLHSLNPTALLRFTLTFGLACLSKDAHANRELV